MVNDLKTVATNYVKRPEVSEWICKASKYNTIIRVLSTKNI
jgi:hypothetical protein